MRKLKLTINEKEYILEYDRDSIKWLEANGFSLEEFIKKPVTYMEVIWQSLFVKNYASTMNPNLSIKLMDSYIEDKGQAMLWKVINFAVEEYKAFLDALAGTDSEKKIEELEIIEQ